MAGLAYRDARGAEAAAAASPSGSSIDSYNGDDT